MSARHEVAAAVVLGVLTGGLIASLTIHPTRHTPRRTPPPIEVPTTTTTTTFDLLCPPGQYATTIGQISHGAFHGYLTLDGWEIQGGYADDPEAPGYEPIIGCRYALPRQV